MKYIAYLKVESWWLDAYPEELGIVPKACKRGQGRGSRVKYLMAELSDGAYQRYADYLLKYSRANWALLAIHNAYLELIRDAQAYNDPADLEEFKDAVRHELKHEPKLRMRDVRQYLNVEWEDLGPNRPRLEMRVVEPDFSIG